MVPEGRIGKSCSSALKETSSAPLNKTSTHPRQFLQAHGKLKAITLRRAIAISFVHVFFLGTPDHGECDVIVAWHIAKGHFGNTSLDGLSVVAAFHAPGNMFTGPKWKAALYLDEKAGKEQADALGKIYSGQAGGFFAVMAGLIGEIVGARSVPIKFEIAGKRRTLQVPATIELTI